VLKAGAGLPLTPALSPSEGERENRRHHLGEAGTPAIVERLASALPLPRPGGEGRGEGDVRARDHHQHASDTAEPSEPLAGGGLKASTIFTGFGIGLAYKTLMAAFRLWKDVPEKVFGAPLKGGSISAEISPELLGVVISSVRALAPS